MTNSLGGLAVELPAIFFHADASVADARNDRPWSVLGDQDWVTGCTVSGFGAAAAVHPLGRLARRGLRPPRANGPT